LFSPVQTGTLVAPAVKAGDRVLLPEYGGSKVTLEDKVSFAILSFRLEGGVACPNSRAPVPWFVCLRDGATQEYALFRDSDLLGVFSN
jgi:hypothetical protein